MYYFIQFINNRFWIKLLDDSKRWCYLQEDRSAVVANQIADFTNVNLNEGPKGPN